MRLCSLPQAGASQAARDASLSRTAAPQVSDDLLKSYLDSYAATPWEALKYLIAEANYGGRVTDELDRRVLASYLNKFYCEAALGAAPYLLSPLPTYFIPANGPLASFKDYVAGLPPIDAPEAFGQHPNAEISYLIEDSKVRCSLATARPGAESSLLGLSVSTLAFGPLLLLCAIV